MDTLQYIRRNINWLLKEQTVFFLPFVIVTIGLWIPLTKLLSFFFDSAKIKKEKPVIAFTSIFYNGNARAIFEKINLERGYCYWIARNMKTYRYLRRIGRNVVYLYFPFAHLKLILTTDALITNDSFLVFLFRGKKPKFIQVKHGVGPKGSNPSKEDFDLCDAWCVSSEYVRERHIQLWKAPPHKIYATGFARLDFLYRYINLPKEDICRQLGVRIRKKIILYAPTFDIGLWPWGDPYKGFERLCKFCEEKGLTLIVRLHPLAKIKKRKLSKIVRKYENVYWIDMDKEPETMKLLAVADVLITDWSSIYTDFLLTGRPIVFLEVNPEYFTKLRGKSEIPASFRAGEIVKREEELYQVLDSLVRDGNPYEEKQRKLLNIIHGKVDGRATERTISVIERVLSE